MPSSLTDAQAHAIATLLLSLPAYEPVSEPSKKRRADGGRRDAIDDQKQTTKSTNGLTE